MPAGVENDEPQASHPAYTYTQVAGGAGTKKTHSSWNFMDTDHTEEVAK